MTAVDRERIEALIRKQFPEARAHFEPIPAGLGDRRFYRVSLDGTREGEPERLIARVEAEARPPDPAQAPFTWLPEPRLEPIRAFLESAGIPVPRSYGRDFDQGIDLLEDVGQRTLLDTVGEERRSRYFEASELIDRLQALEPPTPTLPAFERHFDARLVRTKAAKLIAWNFPGVLDREATDQERRAIESGFDAIAQLLADAPQRLSHRDFKAENLHLAPTTAGGSDPHGTTTPSTEAHARLVMIDVQGAFVAPLEYDRVCLLRDLQVELPEPLVDEIRDQVGERFDSRSARAASDVRFDAIAVLRLSKDVAHIVHAARTRGDRRRWHEIPRGLELLEESLIRLERTFSPARALHSVMHVLTRSARTSDSPSSRQGI